MARETVAVYRTEAACYPRRAPFHPTQRYPEYAFGEIDGEQNVAYDGVRSCLYLAGLDTEHYGTQQWNPLGGLIHPGERVLIKPNLIKESHPRDPEGWQYMLTHGSIVRAVADYVWKALDNHGTVLVGDAPQSDSSFDGIARVLGLDIIRDFYRSRGLDFELIDLRQEEWVNRDGVIVSRKCLPGDPAGYVSFDLGRHSEFVGHSGSGRYYGADYDAGEVNRHHSEGRHEYLIGGSAINCDVILNLPKLKTHKKTGITVGLKNLVGVNGNKNWLPHHTKGDPSIGGDEYPGSDSKRTMERVLATCFQQVALRVPVVGPWLYRLARRPGIRVFGDTEDVIRSGNWWGNDTCWRMCLDLNKIVSYGNADGSLRTGTLENRKRQCILVDGIIAGQGHGPLNPDPVYSGILVFGMNAPSVDAICAWLMGYDPERIPIVRQAFRCRHYPLVGCDWSSADLISNVPQWNGVLSEIAGECTLVFEPAPGWRGHVEREESSGVVEKGQPR